ncbi:hypothetical protein I3842_07G046100 [Carya illinoinensis]|uniref:Kinesin motor domain-containing protein n=1 Tax=Carya illinoinensis TaxID=32201 RepID=A0A922EFC2_CARIL|nr:hypothetical protein I3842_07G046100 [Carya illinoinensis]
MEETRFDTYHQDLETLVPNCSVSEAFDWEKVEPLNQEPKYSAVNDAGDESLVDSMLCDSGSRLIPSGFTESNCTEECVLFINAGGEAANEVDSSTKFVGDTHYEGGNVFRTNESITEGGDFPFIYQTARLGNFSYHFNDLPPGDYFVDLHFAEIINTNGPKGMRVFNIYVQEEKVLSELDIFSVVGANKPLQLVDLRVSMKEDGAIVIRFEGVNGSPVVSGICIRKAPKVSVPQVTHEYLKCNNCASMIEVPSAQKKLLETKSTMKYEKKIEELTMQCQRKTKECYEAWMSLTSANEQLDKVRMELDNVMFNTLSKDQTMEKQAENLRNISGRYEHDQIYWAAAINNLHEKIKVMKKEHLQLSCEAHDCVDSIPELNKMVFAVQTLVAQCEDLKVKYSEEQAKRKKLFNEFQEAKGNIRVFCRCRPLSKEEISAGSTKIVEFDAAKDGCLGILTGGSTKKSFKFDRVYTPNNDQVDVFEDASPMVTSVLDGYNVCIFAYGQTGTGKTFTMEGTEQNRGVNYRTLEHLFNIAKERSETFTYSIAVSVLEVYNEQIRDLLATSPTSKKLEIKQASEGFLHEKIKELEGQIELKTAIHNQSEKQLWQLSERLKGREEVCSNLQQKVKELEMKLVEQRHSESASFQQKVKELENKLKEELQKSESYTVSLQHEVNELERKLKEQEQNSESCLLHQKIKELEDKLKVQEQQSQDCTDAVRATPKTFIRDELMNEIEPRILRSSNSINRPLSQGSTLQRGNDSFHEMRRKRDFRNADAENNIFVSSSLNDTKVSRKSDPPKIARVMRTTKLVTATQGPLMHKRTSRDYNQGIKERENKKKIWS